MPTRRSVIAGTGLLCASALIGRTASGTPALRDAAVRALTQGAPIKNGRVRLTIPAVAENGLSVFTTVTVDSPMTEADHVRKIHILSEQNPIAHLLTWHLGPRAGRATVSTNIRLAASQQVMALVEMSDGSFWRDSKPVVVTIAACIDSI